MFNYSIRAINKNDNPKIAQVIRSIFIADNYPKTGTAFADKQLDSMYETYLATNAIYFVLENQLGDIVGGAGIAPLENENKTICELQKMYFLPEVRGKGLGKKLILLCLQTAKIFGYTQCYLETLPEMKIAQKLYTSVGFEYLCAPMGTTGHTNCPVWMIKNL
ncbi:GNAT family N-acetyltransferase [Flavobacterium croceum]|uniref:Putative acetyltransferase n=1 Tax=Flavobacterium croceum DSM 17960 TaxID=1121886 RepID=A0A2S4N5B5_9FLAO|nr:GNAT family N-acetyltransferase [Flavobacterium croceum]POS00866.1 putative acetyltransferase [Flavobacterium croceum DSM 17960]